MSLYYVQQLRQRWEEVPTSSALAVFLLCLPKKYLASRKVGELEIIVVLHNFPFVVLLLLSSELLSSLSSSIESLSRILFFIRGQI